MYTDEPTGTEKHLAQSTRYFMPEYTQSGLSEDIQFTRALFPEVASERGEAAESQSAS